MLAIGVAVGLGTIGLAILGTIIALIVLAIAGRFEFQEPKAEKKPEENK